VVKHGLRASGGCAGEYLPDQPVGVAVFAGTARDSNDFHGELLFVVKKSLDRIEIF
jgi:hypothetical protein